MINIDRVRKLIKDGKYIISRHARIRMFERNITTEKIMNVILYGEVVEEYLDDKPCPSLLMLGFVENEPYHVVLADCGDYVVIITVYKPSEDKWYEYRFRR